MNLLLVLALLAAQEPPIVIRTAEAVSAESVPAMELPEGETGVLIGAVSGPLAEIAAAARWRSFDPKGVIFETKGLKVMVSAQPRDQVAKVLRENPEIALCVVSGKGGGDPEPLKIGEAWMVQAPGDDTLWGRVEVHRNAQGRVASVTNRFGPPDGLPSGNVAAAKKKIGVVADPLKALREGAKPAAAPEAPPLETANRACRLRIVSASERPSYGSRVPTPGRRFLVLDAEFENIIPLTLVKSNQVPTQYKVKELGDHLYLVVNGARVSRLLPEGHDLPGHLPTRNFGLDRLGSKLRGNLVYEIPSKGAESLALRFYDFAHGHMALDIRGTPPPEAKPLVPLQENEVLEAGVFGVARAAESAGKKAPDGMTYLQVDLRARSKMETEADASAFDPKAKPKEKLRVGTVSDWKDAMKHLHVIVDGEYSYAPAAGTELGEAPRFIPQPLTGGLAVFLIPAKAASIEVRGDFPNAALPDGSVIRPRALTFLLEGARPAPVAGPAVLEIDDDVFKVAVTKQSIVPEFGGSKPVALSDFLVLDVTVRNTGTKSDFFQTPEQLLYVTEKGQQLPLLDSSYKGPRPAAKLLLVPPGERRSFQVVFVIPRSDRKPRLAYRGISKAVIEPLKPLEPLERSCAKCKEPAGPADKFCAKCGTKFP